MSAAHQNTTAPVQDVALPKGVDTRQMFLIYDGLTTQRELAEAAHFRDNAEHGLDRKRAGTVDRFAAVVSL